MGGSNWDDTAYSSRVSSNKAAHGTAFVHHKAVSSGAVAKAAHKDMDPKGIIVRESRDSDAHPQSNAIAIGLDVTASNSAAQVIHEKLPTLMGLLTRKNYIPHPQIMFSAIGDATCDSVPLQVGQFESGAEMEGDLSKIYMEGGGGGQMTESYELYAHFMLRHTAIDCMEKRNKRGYIFIFGDEKCYPQVKSQEVNNIIGGGAEANVPTETVFNELRKKFNVFFVLPEESYHGHDQSVIDHWAGLVSREHVLLLKDANAAAELIATQIGLCEGTTDIAAATKDLEDHGTSTALVKAAMGSVSKAYAGGTGVATVEPGALSASSKSSSVERL